MKFFPILSLFPLLVVCSNASNRSDKDAVSQEVWRSYFKTRTHSEIEVLLTEGHQTAIPRPLVALAYCLIRDGKGIHSRLKEPISSYVPFKGYSLIEALLERNPKFGKFPKLIIDPLDFVFIWESSHGLDISPHGDIRYNSDFSVPDFEFTSAGNAKAILYALLTITHVDEVNFELAGKLLRSITSECYSEMCKLDGFIGLFRTVNLCENSTLNHFVISLSTEHVPQLRIEAADHMKRNHLKFHFFPNGEREEDVLLAEALRMTPRQVLYLSQRLGVYAFYASTKDADSELKNREQPLLYRALLCIYNEFELSIQLEKFYEHGLIFRDSIYESCLKLMLKFYEGELCPIVLTVNNKVPEESDKVAADIAGYGTDVGLAINVSTLAFPLSPTVTLLREFSLFFGLPPLYHRCEATGRLYYIHGGSSTLYAGKPFEVALKKLSDQNMISDIEYNAISAASFEFIKNFQDISADRKLVFSQALGVIESRKPLMLFRVIPGHVVSVVIDEKEIHIGDRGPHKGPETITVRKLSRPIDTIFLLALFDQFSDFDRILAIYTSADEPRIIRSLGIQYTGNCLLQAWLLGFWSLFELLKIPQLKYRALTNAARQYMWQKAKIDFRMIPYLTMASLNQPIGSTFSYSLGHINARQKYKLLENLRRAFFSHYFQSVAYIDIVDDHASPFQSLYERKLEKRNITKTNGREIMRWLNDIPLCAENAYGKILSKCLLNQGEGVSLLLQELQKLLGVKYEEEKAFLRLRKLAATSKYTLVDAVIYSAVRHNLPINPLDFEAVWELTFGTDWRTMPVNRFHESFHAKRPIKFKAPPTAKAVFYALLFLDEQVSPPFKQIENVILMLEEKMIEEFPPLRFVKGIFASERSVLSEFPFHNLQNTYLNQKPAPSYDMTRFGWIFKIEDFGFNSLPNSNAC